MAASAPVPAAPDTHAGTDPGEQAGGHPSVLDDAPLADLPADPLAAGLTEVLDGRHAQVRRTVRALLPQYASVLEDAERLPRAEFRERVKDVVLDMAGSGASAMGFPAEYGGGEDIGASIAAFETLAYGDLSVLVKTGVQFGLFGGAVLQLGTKRHHDAYLADIVAGRLLGSFAMTEIGHGSNVAALATTAVFDPATDEFVITSPDHESGKDYIGNAACHARMAVVFAQLEVGGERHGVHALLVPVRSEDGEVLPGVRVEDDGVKMGLNGVDNGRLWFDGVRVPREALLNRFADVSADGVYSSDIESAGRRFFTMLGTLVQGRVSVGAAGLSASKVALTVATRYALRRRQFEGTKDDGEEQEELLLDYGLHQRRLLPLLARTYALHFAQARLTGQLHDVFSGVTTDEESRRLLESQAAGMKATATWHATRTIQECREACGGAGYLAINRFAALKADTDVFTTFEGDNHVLLQLVAKGLLTDYASDFEDLDQLGMVRSVAGLAVDTVLERTRAHQLLQQVRDLLPSGVPGSTSGAEGDPDAGLLDPDYQLAMFRFREEHLIGGVARRLKRGVDSGLEAAEVFSRVQDHVIAAARAHVERTVLEAFVDAVAEVPEGPVREALDLLLDLYALTTIEADRAWFMEHGRLSAQRSKAITREVGELCRKVRPLARPLVDAFAVPEPLLRAPELIGEDGAVETKR